VGVVWFPSALDGWQEGAAPDKTLLAWPNDAYSCPVTVLPIIGTELGKGGARHVWFGGGTCGFVVPGQFFGFEQLRRVVSKITPVHATHNRGKHFCTFPQTSSSLVFIGVWEFQPSRESAEIRSKILNGIKCQFRVLASEIRAIKMHP
jgi:hypothetical protein